MESMIITQRDICQHDSLDASNTASDKNASMEIKDKLKAARKKAKLSQPALAELCGWESQSRISNYETGERMPSIPDLMTIANALKVPLSSLIDEDPIQGKHGQNTHDAAGLNRIPLVSWVRAGDFCENNDTLASDGLYVETTYRARSRTFALIVEGPSMEPKFPDGCTIIVEPDEQAVNGSFIVVRQNGDQEATFKQLIIDGGKMYLKALNPDWPKRIIEMMPDAVICGVVKKFEMDV